MNYNIDPELRPWLAMLPDLDVADLANARAVMADAMPPFEPPAGIGVTSRQVPGRPGDPDVPVLVFSPDGGGDRPALVYMHGGGFVLGSAESDRELPAALAARAGAVVISVDYRLAPENPFPAPVEDCFAALRWVADNAGDLGVDPARIGIGGVSAGAGLAAATALLARDRGGPRLAFQLLDIPELDDRLQTDSMQQFLDTPVWNRANAVASWRYYLGEPAAQAPVPAYAAPARATDLAGLPPAYISTCEFDPLRDEALDYARRLVGHGVPVELHLYPGTFHGSGGLVPTAAISMRMREELLDAARRGLAVNVMTTPVPTP